MEEDDEKDNKTFYQIFSNLRKIIKTVDIYSSRLKEIHSINASQLSCLLALAGAPSMSLSVLSKKVSLSPSMITIIIDQLEEKGLLTRNRSKTDRRVVLIELTETGKEVIKKAPLSFQNKLIEGLMALDQTELDRINTGLEKLLSIIVAEVLLDSTILSQEDTLVGVDSEVIRSETGFKG